jgi:hypothetical protein
MQHAPCYCVTLRLTVFHTAGRSDHAVFYACTFGGFGLGWLRDMWRIPDYVLAANNDKHYLEQLKAEVTKGGALRAIPLCCQFIVQRATSITFSRGFPVL